MLWFYLALLTAIFWTFEHAVIKKILRSEKPEYVSLATTLITSLLSIFLIVVLLDRLTFNKKFLLILIPVALVNATARILYAKSLKLSPMSKAVPLLSLSPIFTLIFAFFIIAEVPPLKAVFGIILAIVGVYLLNIQKFSSRSFFEPFASIIRNKGVFFMFLVSIIYGLGGVLDKYGVSSSNVLTYLLLINPVSLLAQGAYLWAKDKNKIIGESSKILRGNLGPLILLSIVAFVTIIFQFWAVSLTFSSYVIAVKRISALFSVLVGYWVFKERKNVVKTIVGTIIILAGTYFVLFS